MSDTVEVTELVDAPIIAFNDDAPYRCEVCASPLTYGGRGRKPRFCDDHKKGSKGTATRSTNMKQLEQSIAEMYRMIGAGIGFVDMHDAMIIASNADELAKSWIVLAEANPKVKKFLVKMTTGGGTGAVVIAHAMVAFPIMKHHNMLPSFFTKDMSAS